MTLKKKMLGRLDRQKLDRTRRLAPRGPPPGTALPALKVQGQLDWQKLDRTRLHGAVPDPGTALSAKGWRQAAAWRACRRRRSQRLGHGEGQT